MKRNLLSVAALALLPIFGAGGFRQAPKAASGEELSAGESIPESGWRSCG